MHVTIHGLESLLQEECIAVQGGAGVGGAVLGESRAEGWGRRCPRRTSPPPTSPLSSSPPLLLSRSIRIPSAAIGLGSSALVIAFPETLHNELQESTSPQSPGQSSLTPPPQFSLAGRTALITGGARGCGLSFAEGLAEAGADIAIFDIIPPVPSFFEIATTHSVRTAHYTVDVSSEESLKAGFEAFVGDFDGKLDICVPCAGINRNLEFLETSFEEHQKLLGVNVLGVYHTAQLAAKQMIKNGTKCGSIILVASIASYMAIRSQRSSAYCGTKGAVRAMVPGIAAEMVQYVGS